MHNQAFRRLPARSAPVGPMLLLIGATCLAGCAEHAKVTSAWQDNVPHAKSFARVMVVGVTPDVNQRCAFEHFLASRMSSKSTTAFASCDAVTQKDPLTRESIDQAVAAQKADAVVATILVSKKFDAQEGGGRDTRGGAYYKATDAGWATGYYGAYGVPVIYGDFQTAAAITTITGEVEVASKFYETRGATLIYTLNTKAKNLESRDVGLSSIAGPIAERLRRDGLIR